MTLGFSDIGRTPVKRAAFTSAAADATLVAAVSGRAIRVIGLVMTSAAATSTFKSGSTTLFTLVHKAADPAIVLPWNPDGWMQTAVGEALVLSNAGVQREGYVLYVEC